MVVFYNANSYHICYYKIARAIARIRYEIPNENV